MGQQQLLLVILVVIIVGISTLVAVNIFGNASNNANRDAVSQDLFSAAANIQTVWEKPEFMNGAGRNFENLNASQILDIMNIPSGSFDPNDLIVTNSNGEYGISEISEKSITVTGIPNSDATGLQLTIFLNNDNNWEIELEEYEE